jgi:hypothetical protein
MFRGVSNVKYLYPSSIIYNKKFLRFLYKLYWIKYCINMSFLPYYWITKCNYKFLCNTWYWRNFFRRFAFFNVEGIFVLSRDWEPLTEWLCRSVPSAAKILSASVRSILRQNKYSICVVCPNMLRLFIHLFELDFWSHRTPTLHVVHDASVAQWPNSESGCKYCAVISAWSLAATRMWYDLEWHVLSLFV